MRKKHKQQNVLTYMVGIVLAMVVILGSALLFIGSTDEKKSITLGHRDHIAYTPLYVALEQGYFEQEGLVVKQATFETTNQMVAAVVSGHVDAVLGGANLETIYSIEEKFPNTLQIFTTLDVTEETGVTCVMVKAGSSIQSMTEITGMRAATLPGTFSPLWVNAALNTVNMSIENIILQSITPGLQLGALESEQIEILFTVEPVCTFGVNTGVGNIIYNEPLRHLGSSVTASIMSASLAENNPEIAQKIVMINDKAIDFIRNNPEEAIAIMTKYTGYRQNLTVGMKAPSYSKSTEVNSERLQELADRLHAEEALDTVLNVRGILYN